MAITMYQASVPLFTQMLTSLQACLNKGAAYAEAKKLDPAALINARLAPDMHPLNRQVFIATDQAKGGAARLCEQEPPLYEDTETTFQELDARLNKTLDFIKRFKPAQFEGSEDREITMQFGPNKFSWKGSVFLFHIVLPNLYFHVTTAYDILRHNGVDVGKRDYLGTF
jgi:hypothetical protein